MQGSHTSSISNSAGLDRPTLLLYLLLISLGWFSIYASDYGGTEETIPAFYDLSTRAGKQLLWIAMSGPVIIFHLLVNYRFYESFSYLLYGIGIVLLIGVLFLGKEVAGSRSWFALGPIHVQPSELVKYATVLALAKYMSPSQMRPNRPRNQLLMLGLMGLPVLLIIQQGDTGTAMVYSSLLLVTYRGGMSPALMLIGAYFMLLVVLVLFVQQLFLIAGVVAVSLLIAALVGKQPRRVFYVAVIAILTIGFVTGLEFAMQRLFKPYQYKRIQAMIRPDADPLGYGWNVTQSKIAIGAGGLSGKGYLQGTQTKFDFVPEKTTDFIFCTIGEELGWLGSIGTIVLFVLLILRIVQIAERQNSRFALLYGHGVAAVLFFHFSINIAMTIGLFPVVGLPLPFISYGGSSFIVFTGMLFTLLKLDIERKQVVSRF